MRTPFAPSTVVDERHFDHVSLPEGAQQAANFLSRQLRKRVGTAARRAPKQIVSIPLVDSEFRLFFKSFEKSCLWIRKMQSDDRTQIWYSPYFQAGETVARFEDFHDSKDSNGVTVAAGSIVVFKAGDCCVLLPPFIAAFKHEMDAGRTLFWSFTLTFQLGVVPARPTARLTLAPSAPSFDDKRWIFVPEYNNLERHAEEHIQRICKYHDLCPLAASMRAALSWEVEKNPFPNESTIPRKFDTNPKGKGWLWSEIMHDFIMTKDRAHEKKVIQSNWNFRLKRIAEHRNRQRLEEEYRERERHDALVKEGRRETRRRKKRAKLNVELQVDDDALSYSSADSLTLSEEEWLRENNARCRRGY